MTYNAGTVDVAVIGEGHEDIEAGLAAARLGCSTVEIGRASCRERV